MVVILAVGSRQEYIEGQNKRIMPDDLMVAELYTLMVDSPRIDRVDSLFGLRLPTRVDDIRASKNGLYVVHMAFQLKEPKPNKFTYAKFNQYGFWVNALEDGSFGSSGPWARHGYFLGYEEPRDGGTVELKAALEQPRVLETV
ncbi:hypothetical protein A3D14_02705 [Candidatus Saccharibacteria bacterium RIFCSPHIGHO2_02_FULL_47_12]|nr:MAG: hypothetical protein A3D14_02705 [Candidatus Saccharibacteria bacterium RIFCSPHIGHO2_02_FULL_47_12]